MVLQTEEDEEIDAAIRSKLMIALPISLPASSRPLPQPLHFHFPSISVQFLDIFISFLSLSFGFVPLLLTVLLLASDELGFHWNF